MSVVVAIPHFPIEALKNQISGKSSRTVGADFQVGSTRGKTAGGESRQDHIHLLALVAFGRLEELEEDGSSTGRQSAGFGLRGCDIVNIAPAKGETFRGAQPA
jgi:hypothetical protein